jgi:hypothetical protein
MKIPLLLAHGAESIPVILIGAPAALVGLVCLLVAWKLALSNTQCDDRVALKLSLIGVALIGCLMISPWLGFVTTWLFKFLS